MFRLWPEDVDWSWHLLRPIAEGIYGGGEFNEIYRAAEHMRAANKEDWHREWLALARHVEGLGDRALAAGYKISARDHYLRACNYYRWAEFFMAPDDADRLAVYDRCIGTFRQAGQFFQPPLEQVEIPYEGASLPGYFYAGTGDGRKPGLLYVAGADVLKEELYFLGGKAAMERGLALLVMDGPGQGETLRYRGLVSRPDYELPIGAALDYLQSRPEVDPDRLLLLGRSFGGYYAARAAAFDHRPRALAIFGALYDGLAVYDYYPTLRRQFQWLVGARDPEETRERLHAFTLSGILDRITCPVLVLHGEDDHLVPPWHAQRTFDEVRTEKQLHLYRSGEPGAIHCQYDSFPETIPLILDWLTDRG